MFLICYSLELPWLMFNFLYLNILMPNPQLLRCLYSASPHCLYVNILLFMDILIFVKYNSYKLYK